MSETVAEDATTSVLKKVTYTSLGQALYHLVSFFEGYDQQVLSMCMRAFELTLGLSQTQLSTLSTVSTMSRMGCCLIWGLLADWYDSNYVLGGGLLLMGMASIFLSSASHYKVILFLRFLHGFGFACVYPVQQKIVADSTGLEESKKLKETSAPQGSTSSKETQESKDANDIFTRLQALNCIGRLICAVITTLIARKVLLGYYGWRTSYVVLGYVWILFGIAIVCGMQAQRLKSTESFPELISGAFNAVFTSGTAWICIFTIFIAEAPMCAFNYMTIYLQYLGVSDTMAGVAIAVTLIGGAAGSGAGGEIIKALNKVDDNHAEPSSGCAVMIVRYVVCLLFFLGPAPQGKLLWYHYVELAVLGATLVSVGGVDRPVMKNAIQDKYQATASAIIRTISGISSSVILYQIAGYLTEKVFGYVPSRESFESMEVAVKERNAEALRKSMMYIILAGTTLNLVCYLALFCTYKGDKKKVGEQNEEEAAVHTELENGGACGIFGVL
ncbi:MAJOR FACILITATOR SUPERFAMILY MEMBER protein, putative [Babesia bigemina]|uniref:MAJOR FACILITATOR SUPERFAMILY MEMBER protein, putative n=1 Tax=Babesia bigemina TaxID=5866 RepID=A0A061D212_BABBI|nr:MAJOR FACILITATOR SUPERFAMILY MEMBER protein, putative [Babesia bigemina]CDR94668.1 MAJOR FACILITATOR SUPERFAMILY MEMBER protein, putative [Babesia bigemina]|eukprot:XP_012766854.1 MAJOR FACILITATOR SUPERFAMILY MEMBER protein, putative [Babesia bigemina]